MTHVNRSSVRVDLKNVRGKTIADPVTLTFYNQRAHQLSQTFSVKFKGRPVTLPRVPAFPFGLAEVFIDPTKYRYKSIFINVPAGKAGQIEETCFVEPEKVKPSFPNFTQIRRERQWKELSRILEASGISSVSAWNKLSNHVKAGLLNILAKLARETLADGRPVVGFVERIVEFRPARVFALVNAALFGHIQGHPAGFHVVSGALHKFPSGWKPVEPGGSFKTHDKAGNLQLTFARNKAGQLMADIDIDDHQGIKHAADVLKHKITGKDTHPYDIHQILIYFQGLDPGYALS